MNINVALTPMDRLADEFGSKVKIEKNPATLSVRVKRIEKSVHQRQRRNAHGSLTSFLRTREGADEEKMELIRDVEALAQEIQDTTNDLEALTGRNTDPQSGDLVPPSSPH
jgi:hypothetical protein